MAPSVRSARSVLTRRRLLAAGALSLLAPRPVLGADHGGLAVLDWGLTETALALGLVPSAVAEAPLYRRRVVSPALPSTVVDLGLRTWPNLERLRALRPRLIVSLSDYGPPPARLEAIAPTLSIPVYTAEKRPFALAGAALDTLAEATGRPDAARRVRADVAATLARARRSLAPRRDRPVLVIKFASDRHIDVFGAGSLFGDVLDRLGLPVAWSGPTNLWGYTTTGLDALADHPEARVVIIAPAPPRALATSRLWQSLPAVRAGHVVTIPPTWVFGTLPSARRFARQIAQALA